MRYALITNDKSTGEEIGRLLYPGWEILAANLPDTLIYGDDSPGATLEDTIGHLAAYDYTAREVRGKFLRIAYSECAMHCGVAGHDCHVYEEDRYMNGREIPVEKRYGCFVISSDFGRVHMLKDEAGWRSEVRDVTDELSTEAKPHPDRVPRGIPGCTCGTPPFAPPEPASDCPFHSRQEPIHGDDLPRPDDQPDVPMAGDTW